MIASQPETLQSKPGASQAVSSPAHFPAWWPTVTVETSVPDAPAEDPGLWAALKALLDVQQFKPAQAQGIISKEMNDGSGHHFLLKNPRTHSYARLLAEEFWIWENMLGEKTVQQLVFAYFMKYKAFAFAAIVSLVERLREATMLSEAPNHLYTDVTQAVQEQSSVNKLTWFARTVLTKEFTIKRLDLHLDRIHRYGGWLLFVWPVQLLFLLVSLLGIYLFIVLTSNPQYKLLQLDAAIQIGLMSYIPLVIHEFGHAITAKHVGCEVYKGGVMLYYGMPAAFVDTTDVWMFSKKARLSVTWAGPYTGYILGGIASIVVYLFPALPQASLLLQLAMVSFITSTLNILPLLKLDGYYLLSDSLEIPRLRERSMEFITHQLRIKLVKREKWSREEWIFLVFGLLAFLSTFYFTWSGIEFWDSQASQSLGNLFNLKGNFLGQALAVLLILLAVSMILYSLTMVVDGARRLGAWLLSKGMFSTRGRSALIIALGALVLTVLPRPLLPTLSVWVLQIGALLVLLFASWLAISMFNGMRGSLHAAMWLPAALSALVGSLGIIVQLNSRWQAVGWGLQAAGIVPLMGVFILAGRLLGGLRGAWREVSLWLLAAGGLVWAISLFSFLEVRLLAGLLMLGGLLHWRMRPATQIKPTESSNSGSTRQKLVSVFDSMKSTLLSELALDFGAQTRARVESGAYRPGRESAGKTEFAATQAFMTPGDYGGALALMLEELLVGVERAAGKKYASHALATSFDHLDWELQETAEDYILKFVAHAGGLSTELSARHNDLDGFLRSVPMFAGLGAADLKALARQFKPRMCKPNEIIVQAGDVGDSFYILRAGRAVVLSRTGSIFNTLGRGDYFGEAALLTNEKRNATIQALTPVEVLSLSKQQFDGLIRSNIQFDEKSRQEIHRLGVLRQVPLFEQFTGWELKKLAQKLENIDFSSGGTVFKQGQPGYRFYIIEKGKVSVQIDGEQRATLGAGEYFGEIALLMDAPRTATLVALSPVVLFALQAADFKTLIQDSNSAKQALERASSRRVLSNERWTRQETGRGLAPFAERVGS